MPTVLDQQGYQIMIYTDDHLPPHVHVWRGRLEVARVAIDPFEVMDNWRLKNRELKNILEMMEANLPLLRSRWDEIHGNR
jgi:hypothetical protein